MSRRYYGKWRVRMIRGKASIEEYTYADGQSPTGAWMAVVYGMDRERAKAIVSAHNWAVPATVPGAVLNRGPRPEAEVVGE